ncbi:unnamed protein product [Clavelina lepadiformis]|uniref:Uncharacterized protein n=1 Tax=Clavelina lepadiformis TaxID=159417 RepID=A0ABP0G765_CLALP
MTIYADASDDAAVACLHQKVGDKRRYLDFSLVDFMNANFSERVVRILKDALRVSCHPEIWPLHLPCALLALRATVKSEMGLSASEMTYSFQPSLSGDYDNPLDRCFFLDIQVVQDWTKFFKEMRSQKQRPELNTRTFWDPLLDKYDKICDRVEDGSQKSVAKRRLKPYHELSATSQNSQQPVVRTEQEETPPARTRRSMKRLSPKSVNAEHLSAKEPCSGAGVQVSKTGGRIIIRPCYHT